MNPTRIALLITSIWLVGNATVVGQRTPDFNRDILPLLSENCFACHGPDEKVREADLRLDVESEVIGDADSGHVIIRGDAESSDLFDRISTDDEYSVMPPPDSGKKLTPEQVDLIKRWIDAGAKWEKHWAWQTPKKPSIPKPVKNWDSNNEIDLFIHRDLYRAKLEPESRASREALIRRVTFDLTGLPPTIKEIDAYLADKHPGAYERVVDRLLDSPR